jgi:hypothetical protein
MRGASSLSLEGRGSGRGSAGHGRIPTVTVRPPSAARLAPAAQLGGDSEMFTNSALSLESVELPVRGA